MLHWKFRLLGGGGGVTKNHIEEGDCLKRGTWTVFRFKGGLARKRGVFLRGVDTLMHTMGLKVWLLVGWCNISESKNGGQQVW